MNPPDHMRIWELPVEESIAWMHEDVSRRGARHIYVPQAFDAESSSDADADGTRWFCFMGHLCSYRFDAQRGVAEVRHIDGVFSGFAKIGKNTPEQVQLQMVNWACDQIAERCFL